MSKEQFFAIDILAEFAHAKLEHLIAANVKPLGLGKHGDHLVDNLLDQHQRFVARWADGLRILIVLAKVAIMWQFEEVLQVSKGLNQWNQLKVVPLRQFNQLRNVLFGVGIVDDRVFENARERESVLELQQQSIGSSTLEQWKDLDGI